MKFLFVTCLLLCAFPRTYAFQDSTIAHLDTLSQFDHKSVSAARPLPYYDIHLAMGTAIATRLGARVQFHPHYSVEVFFGQPPAWGFFGPVQHVRAGFGLNWHSEEWPGLVFSLIDATDWNPYLPDVLPPSKHRPFQYHIVSLSGGYLSMKREGINGFLRFGFGYELYRDSQGVLVHGFKSINLDAGFGITF
jgi:hypothetical protein